MPSFSSAAGNETITGGAGTEDVLNLGGAARDARYALNAQGQWVVTTAAGGADTLASIEQLVFADGTIRVSTPPPRIVSDTGVANQNQTLIGVDAGADGGYTVAYITTNDGASSQITLRAIDAGGAVTSTRYGFMGGISDPDFAVLEDGRSVVAFRNTGGVQLAFDQANPTAIAPAATGVSFGAPDVAALEGGGCVVAYTRYHSSTGYQVHASVHGVSGIAPIVLAGNAVPPAVTGLADGGFAITWADNTGKLLVQTYSAAGVAEGPAVTVAPSINASYGPMVTGLADGGHVVTWHEGAAVRAQRFDATGAADGGAVTLVQSAFGVPSVTALPDGGYVLAVNDNSRLVVQQVPGDGSALPPAYTAYLQIGAMTVSVDATADGGFVVGWSQSDAYGDNEAATMRFGADGAPALPTLTGTDGGDRIITSGTGDRRLEGGAGDDRLVSGSGKDWLDGGTGNDTLEGGLGDDTYLLDGNDLLLDTGGIDTAIGSTSFTLQAGIDNGSLTGTATADLRGNALANALGGNAASNVLDGGAGADTMAGGRGNDTYVVDQAGDVVVENLGEGLDSVVSTVSYTLGAGLENLHLTGYAAADATGNAEDNVLVGNTQANVLDGMAGEDTLIGGLGNDVYVVTQLDTVVEDADGGVDTVRSAVSWLLEDGVENLQLTGSAAANGTGNELANTLTGSAGNNILDGGLGADVMQGGNGSDTYLVDDAGDEAYDDGTDGVDQVRATVTHQLSGGMENLVLLGTADIAGTGNAQNNVLRGNAGANRLNGSYGSDLIYGYGGDDFLEGNDASGVDTLVGGLGNDTYYVGATDAVELREAAGQGIDTVLVGAGNGEGYTLGANLENLQLTGFDVYGIGNELNNRITGTEGANRLNGGAGSDVLEGRQGNDTYFVDAATDRIVEAAGAGEGVDEVIASASYVLDANVEHGTLAGAASLQLTGQELRNRLLGNAGANILRGEGGNDVLDGAAGNDSLYGGDGHDRMNGVAGNDRLDGGDGTDTADYSTAAGAVTLDLGLSTAQATGGGGTDTLVGVENAFGSRLGGDKLTGTAGSNLLRGHGGNDTLAGAGGNDRLHGDDGDDELIDGAGDSVINGGAGFDTLNYFAVAGAVTISLDRTDAQATGGAGSDVIVNIEALIGSNTGSDFLQGDFENNLLRGEGGNDTLGGGDGDDTLQGGAGIDMADYSGSVFEVRVSLATTAAQDTEGAGVDTLVDIEGIRGSDWGNDELTGNAQANRLDGGAGSDTLVGALGDDVYVVDAAGDRVVETASAGTDTIESSITLVLGTHVENLRLTGSAAINGTGNGAANLMVGNTAANALVGGAGNDTLAGGRGSDVLTGGAGADAFRFDVTSGGIDAIKDFVVVDDRIELDNAVFTALGTATGALAASAFVVGAAAADASDRIVYNSANGYLYYDADGSGAGAAVLIAKLTGVPALTVSDFVVI